MEQAPAVVAAFDLSAYELADTCEITLKDARGDDMLGTDRKPVTARIYSPGSPQGVQAIHKASRGAQQRLFHTMQGKVDPKDAENADREQAEKLAAFVESFSKNFPVTPLQVTSNPRLPHLHRQIAETIDKYANFSKGSTPS